MKSSETLRERIRARAQNRSEYCRLHQDYSELSLHLEHIIARQDVAGNDLENLALACHYCNRKKGPNLAGIDPLTNEITPLFHPRRDNWQDHFRWNGPIIDGLTPVGRATANVLALNDGKRMKLRFQLLDRRALD